MTSPINAFGFTVIPVSEYQDLVSGNQTKSDRIDELNQSLKTLEKKNQHILAEYDYARNSIGDLNIRIQNRDEQIEMMLLNIKSERKSAEETIQEIEANSDRQRATITDLQKQVEKLEESDRIATETIDDLDSLVVSLRKEIASLQQDLKLVKENYSKVLAANADLDSKLSEAIANLSATELQCNEQTVQIATLQTSRNALLQDFDSSKRAVNIELDNHRIAILKVVDELERSLRNPSVEVV